MVVNRLRGSVERADGSGALLEVIEAADDVADNLEDAAFYLALLRPPGPAREIAAPLRAMCALLLASVRAHLRAVTYAGDVQRHGASRGRHERVPRGDAHGHVRSSTTIDDAQRTVYTALVASATSGGRAVRAHRGDPRVRAGRRCVDAHGAAAARPGARRAPCERKLPAPPQPSPLRPAGSRSRSPPSDADLYVLGETGPAACGGGDRREGARAWRASCAPACASPRRWCSRPASAGAAARPVDSFAGAWRVDRAHGRLHSRLPAGLGLGDRLRPLVVSVRSGAPVSMPGMLETVLDVGLSEGTVPGLAAADRQSAARMGLLPALDRVLRDRRAWQLAGAFSASRAGADRAGRRRAAGGTRGAGA